MTAALAALISNDENHDRYADRILEAALDQFAIHGIRRTSVEDVAAAAGVGRVTVYRRFSNKDALVQAAALRQLRRLHQDVAAAVTSDDPVEQMVDWFVAAVHRLRHDRLMRRLIDTEPETILPLLTLESGPLLMATSAIVLDTYPGLRAALGDKALVLTELSIRLGTSLILSPGGFASSATTQETRNLAKVFLLPALREHVKYDHTNNACAPETHRGVE